MSDSVREISGELSANNRAFAIIASRFNEFITSRLVSGAVDALERHGCPSEKITVIRVPGSWELPLAAKKVCTAGGYDAVICLGCVIRGETPHFDYVAGQAARGIGQAAMETNVPVVFGVLTTDTLEQAVDRAGAKSGNKGAEAALAAIEMASLFERLGDD